MFLNDDGVGDEANGYSFGSRWLVARGGLITRGGKAVVVVVVVVTTVVRVAGAKENWPSELPEALRPYPGSSELSIPLCGC